MSFPVGFVGFQPRELIRTSQLCELMEGGAKVWARLADPAEFFTGAATLMAEKAVTLHHELMTVEHLPPFKEAGLTGPWLAMAEMAELMFLVINVSTGIEQRAMRMPALVHEELRGHLEAACRHLPKATREDFAGARSFLGLTAFPLTEEEGVAVLNGWRGSILPHHPVFHPSAVINAMEALVKSRGKHGSWMLEKVFLPRTHALAERYTALGKPPLKYGQVDASTALTALAV